jgi:hypothetical protein
LGLDREHPKDHMFIFVLQEMQAESKTMMAEEFWGWKTTRE